MTGYRKTTLSLFMLLGLNLAWLSPQRASAKEGFSITIGLGGGFTEFNNYSLNYALDEIGQPFRSDETGVYGDGFAARLSMAYNIKGYASIELGVSGFGWKLLDDDKFGGGQATLSARFHPVYAWLQDFPLDVYLLVGGGFTLIGGGYEDNDDNRGLRGGCAEVGLGAAWFFTDFFSLGLDYRTVLPFYDTWIVDWDDKEDYDLKSTPHAYIHTLFLTTTFHFGGGS